MALPHSTTYSEQDYLALDQASDIKYEYAAGEVFAMSGATRIHNLIVSNVHLSLGNQLLERPCEIYMADMRVQVRATGSYRYPDICIVCDPPEFADTQPESLLNPTVLIEVISDSSAVTDRIQKLDEYRRIPSLQEYLLISQDRPRIERYQRQDDLNWLYTDLQGLDQQLDLPSLSGVLRLSDVYRRIEFES